MSLHKKNPRDVTVFDNTCTPKCDIDLWTMSLHKKGKKIATKCVNKACKVYKHVASCFKFCTKREKITAQTRPIIHYVLKCSIPLCDLYLSGRNTGLACDMSSWYVKQMWKIILKSLHTRLKLYLRHNKSGHTDRQTVCLSIWHLLALNPRTITSLHEPNNYKQEFLTS